MEGMACRVIGQSRSRADIRPNTWDLYLTATVAPGLIASTILIRSTPTLIRVRFTPALAQHKPK